MEFAGFDQPAENSPSVCRSVMIAISPRPIRSTNSDRLRLNFLANSSKPLSAVSVSARFTRLLYSPYFVDLGFLAFIKHKTTTNQTYTILLPQSSPTDRVFLGLNYTLLSLPTSGKEETSVHKTKFVIYPRKEIY